MKPRLKPRGTKRLKVKADEPLSSFGFKFNLRRYTQDAVDGGGGDAMPAGWLLITHVLHPLVLPSSYSSVLLLLCPPPRPTLNPLLQMSASGVVVDMITRVLHLLVLPSCYSYVLLLDRHCILFSSSSSSSSSSSFKRTPPPTSVRVLVLSDPASGRYYWITFKENFSSHQWP